MIIKLHSGGVGEIIGDSTYESGLGCEGVLTLNGIETVGLVVEEVVTNPHGECTSVPVHFCLRPVSDGKIMLTYIDGRSCQDRVVAHATFSRVS
jgi:hypothetical protein